MGENCVDWRKRLTVATKVCWCVCVWGGGIGQRGTDHPRGLVESSRFLFINKPAEVIYVTLFQCFSNLPAKVRV